MINLDFQTLFTREVMEQLLPLQRADQFFQALYGGLEEGAYDIRLVFKRHDPGRNSLEFELELQERPGKCLACNLTYGLPEVFSRHPVLNLKEVAREIEKVLQGTARCRSWSLGRTNPRTPTLHVIPFILTLE
jgi:hypothetical protein